MSDEARITPQLKKLEAQLQGLQLPASTLDRDEVLYQAGWAAAIAQTQPVQFNAENELPTRWIWPATSGVLAATAALLAVLLFVRTNQNENPNKKMLAQSPNTLNELDSEDRASENTTLQAKQDSGSPFRIDVVQLVERSNGPLQSSSLLSWIQSPFRQDVTTGAFNSDSTNLENPYEHPKTNRQLMNQLLPNGGSL